MTPGARHVWLVALREMRERARARTFQVGLLVTVAVAVAMVALPAVLDRAGGTRDVGLTGEVPRGLAAAIGGQAEANGVEVRVHRYDELADGRDAVREDDIDVLVVDAARLEWRDRADEQLQAIVTGAIQQTAFEHRATAAGIDPKDLLALVAPVPVESVEIGIAEGRSSEDGTAAILISALLLMAVYVYGVLVVTGVVEEKSTRVVEVLLARVSPRELLIGKVVGIGLLGLGQFLLTAVAALITSLVVDAVDLPALDGGVLAWVMVWFVLGYALYAMAYGALGSLASRTEDAQSVTGPVGFVLLAGYWGAFLAVSEDPDGAWARAVSLFPATAPFAMPARIALGADLWWEAPLAVLLTLLALIGLAVAGGRVYDNAILHSGATLGLRDAWRAQARRGDGAAAG